MCTLTLFDKILNLKLVNFPKHLWNKHAQSIWISTPNTDGGPKPVPMGRSGEKFNKFIWIKTHDINELVKGEKKY